MAGIRLDTVAEPVVRIRTKLKANIIRILRKLSD